ncbi:hypothetical protein FHK02_2655 [Spirosoma sp. LMG 31448]|uniref:Uncharacterized protein n=1 Tax=Spirosoma utsteinense TaxID=2585773 RepID=A0ABR6W6Z9_9BACT|nr:hypothetical protein [Spirosoma utsteinense]MBC3792359.1 hypothetical protein [Spirosoma utsteinense]
MAGDVFYLALNYNQINGTFNRYESGATPGAPLAGCGGATGTTSLAGCTPTATTGRAA